MGILFVRKCVLCCGVLPAEDGSRAMICAACADELCRDYRCTAPIHVPGADGAAAALYYTGKIKQAMQRFKFHHKQHYADWFAAQALPLLAEHLEDWKPDLITYMPIGFLRLHKRGYNQAELLAKAIAAPFSLPCRATMRKRPFTPTQSEQKDFAARQENAARALLPIKNMDLSGQSVVLVDDIITTGAMAAAAADLLRKMGAARVYVLAPARTPRK
nr:phosphoribosyltransferase family protein [uncultured Agathobaculum sp.]